jgi:hypothetical protein
LGRIDKKALTYIVLSGIAGALSWITYFFALKQGPATHLLPRSIELKRDFCFASSAALFLSEQLTWKSGFRRKFCRSRCCVNAHPEITHETLFTMEVYKNLTALACKLDGIFLYR